MKTYKVTVEIVETVTSQQTLLAQSETPEEAEAICQENREHWRNHESCGHVQIAEDEDVIDAEMESINYTVEELQETECVHGT